MSPRMFKTLLLFGIISCFILYLMYNPLHISPSSVKVINNLNFLSEKVKQSLNEIDSKAAEKETFRSHNKDSDVKIVQEEKIDDKTKTTKLPPAKEDPKQEVPKKEVLKKEVPEKLVPKKGTDELPDCPSRGTNLVGPLFVDQSIPKDMNVIEKTLSVEYGGTVEKGGTWSPTTCKPLRKVAIIIPFRRRFVQLKIFLRHMHPLLQKQLLHYQIFLVEQLNNDPFNRAGLFNIGFVEALRVSEDFDCFVFTDVDLLPEDDRNYYGCPTSPRHMSVAVDKFHYKLPYATLFGGVGAFLRKDFEEINGMSNLFFGWGGEDDDLYKRVEEMGWKISRTPNQIGRYTMISVGHHQSSKQDPNIVSLLHTSGQRMVVDGLNSLKYKLKSVIKSPLITIFRVEMKRNMYNLQ